MGLRSRSGLTLIEVLIGSTLFVVLGLFLFSLFKYGLASWQRGQINTDVQQTVREIVKKISADLQASALLQVPQYDGDGNLRPVPLSPVLKPSTEDTGGYVINPSNPDSLITSQFFVLQSPTPNPIPNPLSTNILIFTAPATVGITAFNPTTPESYILVRYAVFPASQPRFIMRKTYAFSEVQNQNWLVYGTEASVGSLRPHWYIDTTKLDQKQPVGDPPVDPNSPYNSSFGVSLNDTPWQPIVAVGGPNVVAGTGGTQTTYTFPNDVLTFSVSHTLINNNPNPNLASYDPSHYTIATIVERYVGSPRGAAITDLNDPNQRVNDAGNDYVRRNLQGEVTLPRFNN